MVSMAIGLVIGLLIVSCGALCGFLQNQRDKSRYLRLMSDFWLGHSRLNTISARIDRNYHDVV